MKKLFDNLPFRLLLGIIIGVILGQVFPESVMKVVVTLQYIMGQLITFCVPLIIIGFIAPSITKLGKNASRLLGVAIVIAYVSSVCAALMSTGAGYALIPHLSIDTEVAGLKTLPGVVFELNIPQIMSVMSALVLSVLVFDDAGTALMLAIFALQDSFGTACNVTGDGALTLMLTGYAEKHGIKNNDNIQSPVL